MVEGVGKVIYAGFLRILILILIIGSLTFGTIGYYIGRYVEGKDAKAKIETYKDSVIIEKVDNAAKSDSNVSRIPNK